MRRVLQAAMSLVCRVRGHVYKIHEEDYMMFTCKRCGDTYESQNYN